MVTATSCRELKMLSAVSLAMVTWRSSSAASREAMVFCTADDTSMAVLLCCLEMDREMVSWPSYLEMPPLCSSASYTLATSSRYTICPLDVVMGTRFKSSNVSFSTEVVTDSSRFPATASPEG